MSRLQECVDQLRHEMTNKVGHTLTAHATSGELYRGTIEAVQTNVVRILTKGGPLTIALDCIEAWRISPAASDGQD